MKRTSRVALVPFVVALSACTSSSSPTKAPSSAKDASADSGAGSGDDAGVAAESGSGDDGSSDSSTPATPYAAKLSGAEVVPAVRTAATGTATFALQGDNVTLTYDITQNVPGATSVDVRIGAPGENGMTTRQLTPISGHMTGSIALSPDEQNALSAAQLYIDVESPTHTGGEIRGQLVPPDSTIFVANAGGMQEVPTVTSAYAAHGSFIMSADQTSLLYHVVTTAVPTDVRLHRAIASLNGPTAYALSPVAQTIDGNLQLAASNPADLAAGRFYLNVVTAANPAGELRGQILSPGQTLFTGVLLGSNEVPSIASQATGGAQFVLSPDQTQLAYEADVSGVIPTAAELDNAPAGQNGPMLYMLTLAQQGVLGRISMASGDLSRLTAGSMYINVKTASYANGELRTQLLSR